MDSELRVLMVEDSPQDAELLTYELERAGFRVLHRRVQTAADMADALGSEPWDLVISDYSMPRFSALEALAVLRDSPCDIPFLVVSGTISDETAVEAMKLGAADFLRKGRLTRLGPAVRRELAEAAGRRERRAVEVALAEVQNRAQFALDAAEVGTWEADVLTGLTTWSPVLERLHGLAPGTFQGTVQAFLDLVASEDQPQVRTALSRMFSHGGDHHFVYRAQWPDRSIHWIEAYGRTVCDAGGRIARAAGIGIDVTNQRQLEEQFHQAQKMEAIGRLAGGVAHDFNNLLTAILGYSELVLERVADRPELASDVQEIRRAGEQARRLTSQLLAFSRKQPIAPRALDLNASVSGLERMLQRLIGEDVLLEIAATAHARVKMDPTQVEQLLMNLAVNARDAMPRGGRLRIATAHETVEADQAMLNGVTPGSYVVLRVVDSGSGIPPDVLPRIFDPFFTTKSVGKGTGLGLATVYGIVKQAGGYIAVDSTVGQGTTFAVYMPRTDEADLAPAGESGPVRGLSGTETVLLVEDSVGVRELVRKILVRHGYHVLVSQDVPDALAIAESFRGVIHLLLTDIVMPILNGPDLAQRLVRDRPELRVLYMSGFSHQIGSNIGILSARADFIQKPFSSKALAAKLRECLERRPRSSVPVGGPADGCIG